jgi:hypothetical protein
MLRFALLVSTRLHELPGAGATPHTAGTMANSRRETCVAAGMMHPSGLARRPKYFLLRQRCREGPSLHSKKQ